MKAWLRGEGDAEPIGRVAYTGMDGTFEDVLAVVHNVLAGRPAFEGTGFTLVPLNDDVGEVWPPAVWQLIAAPQEVQRSPGWHAKRFWPVSASTLPSILPGPSFSVAFMRRAVEERAGTLPPPDLPHFDSDADYVAAAEADPALWKVHILRGVHLESYAMAAFEKAFRTRVFEAPSVPHPSGLFTASPDGIGRTPAGVVFLVEAKAPFFTQLMEDLVKKYWHQVQGQLECVPDEAYALLLQYCWRDGSIMVARIDRDPQWFATNRAHIQAFNCAVMARRAEAGITPDGWARALWERVRK